MDLAILGLAALVFVALVFGVEKVVRVRRLQNTREAPRGPRAYDGLGQDSTIIVVPDTSSSGSDSGSGGGSQ
ncbi:hypothetical protein AB0M43_18535 [Longispora sp. NPDC051575]|uniref:hypothetical protein n=1 Tax=Longispora sp. NPDC051575 TaxID=3154943 RepID=UPI003423EED3